MNSPRLSVVIPMFDGAQQISKCLQSLQGTGFESLEIIVVDDASTDHSVEVVGRLFPHVEIVSNDSNLGFAATCNRGLRRSRGPIVALLNQDTFVSPDWPIAIERRFSTVIDDALQPLGATTVENPIGIVGGLEVSARDGQVVHAGGWVDDRGMCHDFLTSEPRFETFPSANGIEPDRPDFVCGASLAISRDALTTIGLLDQDFGRGYYEDVDWCARARTAGFEVVVAHQAIYYHQQESRLDDHSGAFAVHFHSNRFRYIRKHFDHDRRERFLDAELAAWSATGPIRELSRDAWRDTFDLYFGSELHRLNQSSAVGAHHRRPQ